MTEPKNCCTSCGGEDMRNEVAQWRGLAVWLADVTAATAAGDALRKSTSQSARRRHGDICRKILDVLDGRTVSTDLSRRQGSVEYVTERLRECMKLCAEEKP